jgi:hypothetical protein
LYSLCVSSGWDRTGIQRFLHGLPREAESLLRGLRRLYSLCVSSGWDRTGKQYFFLLTIRGLKNDVTSFFLAEI